jgi:hypothetical protein
MIVDVVALTNTPIRLRADTPVWEWRPATPGEGLSAYGRIPPIRLRADL